MTGSARQSISPRWKNGLLRRFAPRNDGKHNFVSSRRDTPELLINLRPKEGAGNAGCALHPRSRAQDAQKKTKENAHEHTGSAETLRHSPRNGFTAYACSPRRRIRLVTVIGGLTILPSPVGPAKISADLTPATDARTTRFCRTLRRRSSGAPAIAHGPPPRPAFTPARPMLSRPPQSLPQVADDHDTPLLRAGTAGVIVLICPTG